MKKTPYFNLPIYEDTDPQDLRDGYNELARMLDKLLHRIDVQSDINLNL